jgi:hypothetical protein
MQVQHAYYHLNLLPHSGTTAFSSQQTHQLAGFFSFFLPFQTQIRVSLQGSIVYLLLTYVMHTHKACHSALTYLITQNPFTPLLGRK